MAPEAAAESRFGKMVLIGLFAFFSVLFRLLRPRGTLTPRSRISSSRAVLVAALLLTWSAACAQPLPSWNDGPVRAHILDFVKAVTDSTNRDFVAPAERIAVFDNDGTLWCEQPIYVQFAFMLDQVKAAAPKHPEWKNNAAFKALMARDHKALADMGHKPVLELLAVANSGMTVGAYDQTIRDWLASTRHPRFQRPHTDLVYQPMLELLGYLRTHGFKTYIVSGGSIEFMRPWAERVYGIPPEQVIGSISETTLETHDGKPVLVRGPKLVFVDDGPGKPVGIYRAIGRRPIGAFGNSDGDLEMLQFTAAGPSRSLKLIVHHDDSVREFGYDRQSHIGKLDKALDQAKAGSWIVASMKSDWKLIFPFEQAGGAR